MTGRLLTLLLLLPVAVLAADPDHEERRQVMGTLATVAAWAPESPAAGRAVDEAFRTFARIDSLMSTWRDDSALTALNEAPAGSWVFVGTETAGVLARAGAVAEASGGAYDPTVLPLVRLWGFRGGEPQIPAPADLADCRTRVGHARLEVDRSAGRARLVGTDMAVDLGGIAKGYALDAAARAMASAGATGGMLDLGGNVLVFGTGPEEEVGIRDPGGPGLLAVVPLDAGSVATSGQYENFVVIGNERFGHILDPRTGRPVPGGLSVTVLADEAILADALATAAVVLGPVEGRRLLERTPGVEGVFVLPGGDGEPLLLVTSGLAEVSP